MTPRPLLPLADYQRIYQVIYSVLESSGAAVTQRSCIFFAAASASILREHYGLPATISAGCLAIMVDADLANVVVYGRKEEGILASDQNAFHAWVECDGWLIDFMAPIMGLALRQDGVEWKVPRQMLQKQSKDRKSSLGEIRHPGDLYFDHDPDFTDLLIEGQSIQFFDLMKVCLSWYRRPPKPLKAIALADTHGPSKAVTLRAPSIEGIW